MCYFTYSTKWFFMIFHGRIEVFLMEPCERISDCFIRYSQSMSSQMESNFLSLTVIFMGTSHAVYLRALELVKQKAKNLDLIQAQLQSSDFELATIQAIELAFLTTQVKVCFFHFVKYARAISARNDLAELLLYKIAFQIKKIPPLGE